MSEENAVSADGFPGEETQEPAAKAPEKEGKWVVMLVSDETYVVAKSGFRFQTDADKWIRENIESGDVLVAARLGTPRRLQVSTRLVDAG